MPYDPAAVLDAIAAELAAVEAEHGLPPERCGLLERLAHPTVAARVRLTGRQAIATAHVAGVSAVYDQGGVLVEAMPDGSVRRIDGTK